MIASQIAKLPRFTSQIAQRKVGDQPTDTVITRTDRLGPLPDLGVQCHSPVFRHRFILRLGPGAEAPSEQSLDRLDPGDLSIPVEIKPLEQCRGWQFVRRDFAVLVSIKLLESPLHSTLGGGPTRHQQRAQQSQQQSRDTQTASQFHGGGVIRVGIKQCPAVAGSMRKAEKCQQKSTMEAADSAIQPDCSSGDLEDQSEGESHLCGAVQFLTVCRFQPANFDREQFDRMATDAVAVTRP